MLSRRWIVCDGILLLLSSSSLRVDDDGDATLDDATLDNANATSVYVGEA